MKSIIKIGLFILPAMLLASCRGNYDAVAKRSENIFDVTPQGAPAGAKFTCVNYYIRITSINKEKETTKKLNKTYFYAKNAKDEVIHNQGFLTQVDDDNKTYFDMRNETELTYVEGSEEFTKVSVGFNPDDVDKNHKFYCNNFEITTEVSNIKI